MITISLCMIVKNEEDILGRCLDSIADLMDEIIIVDTGSSDRTREIAGRYTDKIYDFEWIHDFSAARNFSFSKASMEYIYVADADEMLDEENRQRFLKLKQVLLPEIEVVQMKYCNQLERGTTYNFDVEYRGKLYKRLREFRWVDPIHETVNLVPVVYDSDIEIMHMPLGNHAGRDFSTIQKIINRGERLSRKLHNMYARELYIAGRDADFLEAADFFSHSAVDEHRGLEEVKEAACVLARVYRIRRDTGNFFKNCLKDIASNPSSEVCCELGEYYYENGDYKEAVIWYYNAAYEASAILNIHYAGDRPLSRLADCYERLGSREEEKVYRQLAADWKLPGQDEG